MRKKVSWSAQELLTRHGFDDGQFSILYHLNAGLLVAPLTCCVSDRSTLGQGSYILGEQYPDYVLCLVELLYAQKLQYIVLQDPTSGGDNVHTLDSFVHAGRFYVPDKWNTHKWFATLPLELQKSL